jgi:hypothetical protein
MVIATATLADHPFPVTLGPEMGLAGLLGGEFLVKIEQFHIILEFAPSCTPILTPRVKIYW